MVFLKQFIVLGLLALSFTCLPAAMAEDVKPLTKEFYIPLETFEAQQPPSAYVLLTQPHSAEIQPAEPKAKKATLRQRKNCTISSSYRMCI
jgi:hypothetical protein